MNKKITENYLNVLRHRIRTSRVPDIDRLEKIAPHITRKELKEYVSKAKKAYNSLLCVDDTKQTSEQASNRK